MKNLFLIGAATALAISSSAALAGEITGPPPGSTLPEGPRVSNGKSWCSYSGLNDAPDGRFDENGVQYEPGGKIQNYGNWMVAGVFGPASDPDVRDQFWFPGYGCNPNLGGVAE